MKENRIVSQQKLMREILQETEHYTEALKSDKEFQELREIRERIKKMVARLNELLAKETADKENHQ